MSMRERRNWRSGERQPRRTPEHAPDVEELTLETDELALTPPGTRSGGETAETRLEHSALLRFDAFLARRSPAFIILIGLLLLALFGLIDALTGSFDIAPLYIVPIGLVTFSRGRGMGFAMAIMATLARGAAELARGVTDAGSFVTYWSGLTRLYVFAAVVLMIGPMRDVLRWQREVTETLTETNTQLEALNELRDVLNHEDEPNGERALDELRASLETLDALASRAAIAASQLPQALPSNPSQN
jgi:hypothetical protein